MMLLNAFSINMLSPGAPCLASFVPLSVEDASWLYRLEAAESAVGHASTAAVFEELLGHPVEACRSSVVLSQGDRAIVGQYTGPRLPEGATSLPPTATVTWWLVSIR